MRILLATLACVVSVIGFARLGWADAAVGSISNTTYASRTNTTVPAPSGIQDGDTLIYGLFVGNSSAPTATAPSGFAAPNGGTWPIAIGQGAFNANVYVWYKLASGESGDYTATHSVGSSQGVMLRISGGDGAQPVATTNNGTSEDTTATGLTTSTSGALVGVIAWDWADTAVDLAGPSGTTPTFSEHLDVVLTGVWSGVLSPAGTTGDKTFSNNSSSGPPNPWAAVMFAIEPGGGSGGETPRNLSLMGVGQ